MVTAYFNLTKCYDASPEINAKGVDYYLSHSLSTLNLPHNLVIFCDEDSIGYIKKIRPAFLESKTIYIIKEFSCTKAANLAKYYAGISYFRMNDFNKSVEYLKDFSTSAKQVQAIAYGTIGDAYSELKNTDEALSYYKKAGSHFPDDEAISSEYLYRAASLLELNGKADEAVDIYKEVKSKYPKSEKGLMADKFINKLKVQP